MWDFHVSLSSDQWALIENNGSVNNFQRTKEPWFNNCVRYTVSEHKFLELTSLNTTLPYMEWTVIIQQHTFIM
jgi:hypothetical protein